MVVNLILENLIKTMNYSSKTFYINHKILYIISKAL